MKTTLNNGLVVEVPNTRTKVKEIEMVAKVINVNVDNLNRKEALEVVKSELDKHQRVLLLNAPAKKEIKLSPAKKEVKLSPAQYKKQLALAKWATQDYVVDVIASYKNGEISKSEAIRQLHFLNVPNNFIAELVGARYQMVFNVLDRMENTMSELQEF